MIVKFWGTRGTFPVPGPTTVRYGGDTTCVSVETDEQILVLDTGTGCRALGESLAQESREIAVVYTHIHADHVMGFPFFEPLYQGRRPVHIVDYRLGDRTWSATELLDGVHFPLSLGQLPCDVRRVSKDPLEFLEDFGFSVRRTLLNHPGGAYGYRIESGGKSFVFIPDNEIAPPADTVLTRDELVEFCGDADLVAHDAQFTPAELEEHRSWGHSSFVQATDLGVAANVGTLLLTHHHPRRTDDQLDVIQAQARDQVGASGVNVALAYDGLVCDL